MARRFCGEIGETAKLSRTICNGTGQGSAGHATWPFPGTDFAIDHSETHYNGTPLAKPGSPFTVTLTCNPGGPSSLTQPWLDLTMYARRLRAGEHPDRGGDVDRSRRAAAAINYD